MTISELALRTELSRFSASRHLHILRRSGLVVAEQNGSRLLHRLSGAALEQIEDWIFPLVTKASHALDGSTPSNGVVHEPTT